MEIKKRIYLTLATLLFVACNSETDVMHNSTQKKPSARDILEGNVFYTADDALSETTGYYKEIFSATRLIESEHAEDGTQIEKPHIFHLKYKAQKIIVSADKHSITCSVDAREDAVAFTCDDGSSFLHWQSLDKIQRDDTKTLHSILLP